MNKETQSATIRELSDQQVADAFRDNWEVMLKAKEELTRRGIHLMISSGQWGGDRIYIDHTIKYNLTISKTRTERTVL